MMEGRLPPRVQSAPALLATPDDCIESIFSNLSYRDFLHQEPIVEETEQQQQQQQQGDQPKELGLQSSPQTQRRADAPGMSGLPQRPYTASGWGSSGVGGHGVAAGDVAPEVARQLQRKLLETQQICDSASNLPRGPVAGNTVTSVPVDLLDQIAQVSGRPHS